MIKLWSKLYITFLVKMDIFFIWEQAFNICNGQRELCTTIFVKFYLFLSCTNSDLTTEYFKISHWDQKWKIIKVSGKMIE